MSEAAYQHTKLLVLAAAMGLAGQLAALIFMLRANPYTTLLFFGPGAGLILLGMGVFAFVTYKDVRARVEGVAERHFGAGETIFRQGDEGDRVYFVNSGEVEVIREDADQGDSVLARLGEGEYFGEIALLSDAPRNATVRAVNDVAVLSIERRNFKSLYAGIPALRRSIQAVKERRRGSTS